ncbi:hypothetical protein [Bdellovibrio sp. NC01]|uniref:hypothetical protein n=1 Tax=Bdellovibrio sp. NC01 TaxID=2220073 RepID=UPI0011592BF3|nr:hypothetical protein [Bdellovibrio sp. NC01]QDK38228.1 hypothetical protein DOE51_11875 [Bdellovibrio sp. NC01]
MSCLFVAACTDANPNVAALRALDDFDFRKNFIVASDLLSVPLQAKCSAYVDRVDVSFDGGVTWTNTATYDTSSLLKCGSADYSVTLSNSKAPWSSMTFTTGQTVVVQFRAHTRANSYIYRDISVKYTPSATIRQEVLAGSGSASGSGYKLTGRLRAQKQTVATGSGVILRGRILE